MIWGGQKEAGYWIDSSHNAEQWGRSGQGDIAKLGVDEVGCAPSVIFAVGAGNTRWGWADAVIGILNADGCGLRNGILRERNPICLVGGIAGDVVAGLSSCCS